jgi:hypothetical protein
MKRKSWIFLLALITGFPACNNEVDLIGEYKDTPIIFCLLNPGDTTHYIRIQKAFLINGNVLQTAQIPDSLRYEPSDLDVKVIEFNPNTGATTKTITFQHVPGAVKDTGIFSSEGFMLYKSNESLNDLRRYRLQVTNTKLNKVMTSETGLVYTTSPGGLFKTPGQAGTVIFNNLAGTGYTLRWYTAVNGRVYQPEIVFRWTEVDLATNTATPDSAVWKLLPKVSENDDIGAEMDFNLPQNSFYRFLSETVPVKPGIKRVIGNLNFKMYVGTEELNTYINVNKPSIGLIQDKPVYTNIENGLGLFAGRTTFFRSNVNLHPSSQDTLIFSKLTENLNFRKN